jgi:excisionase family DNA binding protein
MAAEPSDLLTTGSAARLIGVSCDTVRGWVRVGKLEATRVDTGQLLFNRGDCERVREERRQRQGRSTAA